MLPLLLCWVVCVPRSLMMNGAPGPCPSCHLWLMHCACLRPGFLRSVLPFPHPIFSLILLATVLITASAANCFIIPPLSHTMCWEKSPLNPITFLIVSVSLSLPCLFLIAVYYPQFPPCPNPLPISSTDNPTVSLAIKTLHPCWCKRQRAWPDLSGRPWGWLQVP